MALTHIWQRKTMCIQCITASTQLSCVSLLKLQKFSLLAVVFLDPAHNQTQSVLGPLLYAFEVYLLPSVYSATSVRFHRC